MEGGIVFKVIEGFKYFCEGDESLRVEMGTDNIDDFSLGELSIFFDGLIGNCGTSFHLVFEAFFLLVSFW